MDMQNLLQQMTLEEKARLLCGHSTMGTCPIDRLGIPALHFSDGPHGVRAEKPDGDSMSGISQSLPSTCFPTAATTACSWNPENLHRMGVAMGGGMPLLRNSCVAGTSGEYKAKSSGREKL